MAVREHLMQPGSFSLRLVEATPLDLRRGFEFFDHIVITKTRMQQRTVGGAVLLANSLYTGRISEFDNDRRVIEGEGLLAWWGDDDGKGPTPTLARQTANISTWITDLATGRDQLQPVSVVDSGDFTGQTLRWKTELLCARFCLDYICRHFDAEYRVYPTGEVVVGKPNKVFDFNPRIIVTRRNQGDDPLNRGLQASTLSLRETIKPWSSHTVVLGQGKNDSTESGTATTASNPYKDLFGNTAVIRRVIDNGEELTAAEAATLAAFIRDRTNDIKPLVTLSTIDYAIPAMIVPGDRLAVYDPLAGFENPAASEVRYRGQLMHPLFVRVYGYTWPITRGMGVYLRRGSDGGYVDITDHVEFETGDTSYEVGQWLRQNRDADDGGVASGPNLPKHARRVVARTGARHDSWQTWTPVWDSTGTNPTKGNATLTGRYRMLDPFTMQFAIHLTYGSSSSPGTGQWRFSLPATFDGTGLPEQVVAAVAEDESTSERVPCSGVVGATLVRYVAAPDLVAGAYNVSGGVGVGVPWAWATGDTLKIGGIVEIAT